MRHKCESSVGYEKRNVDARFHFSLSRHDQFYRHSPVPHKAHLNPSLSLFLRLSKHIAPKKKPIWKIGLRHFCSCFFSSVLIDRMSRTKNCPSYQPVISSELSVLNASPTSRLSTFLHVQVARMSMFTEREGEQLITYSIECAVLLHSRRRHQHVRVGRSSYQLGDNERHLSASINHRVHDRDREMFVFFWPQRKNLPWKCSLVCLPHFSSSR